MRSVNRTAQLKAALPSFLISVSLAFLCARTGFGAEDTFEWVPLEAKAATSDGYAGSFVGAPVTFTKIPKATADATKFTREYRIDLARFNISTNGANPVETSRGINQALQDAQAAGANRVVFPKGTYLISELDPVVITNRNMIIDLNGSTLQIHTNGLLKYAIVRIEYGAENVRLTNGRLRGDKDAHDYKTVEGSHEWGSALVFAGGSNLEVDHITITNVTGYGVASSSGVPMKDPKRCLKVAVKNIEPGAFSDTGDKVANEAKTRTIKPYELSMEDFGDEFEFGYVFGYMSYPSVMDRNYQACFYDKDMKFLQRKACIQFKKTALPAGTAFIHLEFNQPEVKEAAKHGLCGAIVCSRPPIDVHFHHNVMADNRSLGFGFCGGQRWIMEDNVFERNGGVAPSYGIDFEDGWDFMQDIVFRNNTFKGNVSGDLVVCAGSEMIFEGNTFEKSAVVWGRAHNYSFLRNRFMGHTTFKTRTGVATIRENRYESCGELSVIFDTKGYNDGFVHKPGEKLRTPPLTLEKETLINVEKVGGTYCNLVDCKLQKVCLVAGKDTRLIRLRHCDLSDCSIKYEKEGPAVDVIIEDCKGTLKEEGPGLKRKKPHS